MGDPRGDAAEHYAVQPRYRDARTALTLALVGLGIFLLGLIISIAVYARVAGEPEASLTFLAAGGLVGVLSAAPNLLTWSYVRLSFKNDRGLPAPRRRLIAMIAVIPSCPVTLVLIGLMIYGAISDAVAMQGS
jgi:hypothetical protein